MSKEIRILVDIRVQFYVRSSGTFDEFVVCTLPEKNNFSFIYIYIYKQLKNYRIKLSIRYTRSYIFSLFCRGLVHGFYIALPLYMLYYYY